MVSILYESTICPHCDARSEMHFLHLTTNLGPPVIECHKCRKLASTGRTEWPLMSGRERSWFYGVSVAYLVVAFFLGGAAGLIGVDRLSEVTPGWRFDDPAFWWGAVLAVLLVSGIQVYRIGASRRRLISLERFQPRSRFSFDLNGQRKVLVALFTLPWIAWAATRLSRGTPELPEILILVASAAFISYLIFKWIIRLRDQTPPKASNELSEADELFGLLTEGLDPAKPIRWCFTLRRIMREGSFEDLIVKLRQMGFEVSVQRLDDRVPRIVQFQASECVIHSPIKLAFRIGAIDRFAAQNDLEVSDCSAHEIKSKPASWR